MALERWQRKFNVLETVRQPSDLLQLSTWQPVGHIQWRKWVSLKHDGTVNTDGTASELADGTANTCGN